MTQTVKPTVEALRERLLQAFPGAVVEVVDDSHRHVGHVGAAGGAGHFSVTIVSESFAGRSPLARHRLVYDAVDDWIPHRIHALVISTRTPAEASV
jgi:BolA family transcriptional regulator, general stress-responsive regulator